MLSVQLISTESYLALSHAWWQGDVCHRAPEKRARRWPREVSSHRQPECQGGDGESANDSRKPLTLYLYDGRLRPCDDRQTLRPIGERQMQHFRDGGQMRTVENLSRLFPLPRLFLSFSRTKMWRDQRAGCSLVGQIMKTSTTETRRVNLLLCI